MTPTPLASASAPAPSPLALLTPEQRAGGAYATAGIWGQTGLPTEAELAAVGYVSLPVAPTSDLEAYVAAVKVVKGYGKRVHVAVHNDGLPAAFANWPYTQPDQLLAFNTQVADLLAPMLDDQDTWEVANEIEPLPGGTWASQAVLYAPAPSGPSATPAAPQTGILARCRDAVRAAGVKAALICPITGNQSAIEAYNDLVSGEVPLADFTGWDGIGAHLYAPSADSLTWGQRGFVQAWCTWASYFQNLADKLGVPWIATEYGWENNTPNGPAALFVLRSLIEAFAVGGSCAGGICWQLRQYDPSTSIGSNPAALAAIGASPTLPFPVTRPFPPPPTPAP